MLNKLLFAIVFLGSTLLNAQNGKIKGKVIASDDKELLAFANVLLEQQGVAVAKTVADLEGEFSFNDIPIGVYNLKTVYVGCKTNISYGVIVSADKITQESIEMEYASIMMCPVVICEYMEPLILTDVCCRKCGVVSRECYFTCGLSCYSTFTDETMFEEKSAPVSAPYCSVFPNPIIDFATLEISADRAIDNGYLKIYDVSGKEIKNISFSGNIIKLDRSGIAAGTYIYEVLAKDLSISAGRIVVQ